MKDKVICPLCKDRNTFLRYVLRDKKVFGCRLCYAHFVDPFPDEMNLQSFYEDSASDVQKKYFESFQALRLKSFIKGLKTLEALGSHGYLLDIGTGLGFFLDQARRRGWNVEGLEFSDRMAAYARHTLQLSIHVGTLESAPFKAGHYHVVTLWDVLEHLPDPVGALLRIHTLLIPGGWVVIRTPICDSLIPWMLNLFYRTSLGRARFGLEKLFEEHLFHFSEKGLRQIVERSGFRILRSYREDYIDPHALKRKVWARHFLARFGALTAILASHLLGQQDEVVLYAESIHS